MSQTRVYHLEDGERRLLVRAVSSAQATAFLARSRFPCRVASQADMEAVLTSGGRVHDATDPDATLGNVAVSAAPVAVSAPAPSIAMAGVSSPEDVMRHLSQNAIAAGGEPPTDSDLSVANANHFAKTQEA